MKIIAFYLTSLHMSSVNICLYPSWSQTFKLYCSDCNNSLVVWHQESYVKEVSEHKVNMLLVNKADLLTREQRQVWAKYFEKEGLRAVFWSALAESNRLDAEEKVRARKLHELFSLLWTVMHFYFFREQITYCTQEKVTFRRHPAVFNASEK